MDRRRVLLVANLLRAVLTVVVAAIVFAGVAGPPLYLAALAVAGVSRFVLAGLSASLPHVVARRHLVEANVVAATAGAGVAALGGATAIGARALLGTGDAGSALTTAVAAAGSILAAVLAAGFAAQAAGAGPHGRAGPTPWSPSLAGWPTAPGPPLVRRRVSASFVALAAHRLAFGVSAPCSP